MDWSDISVAECMIEANFPVVPAHGSFVDVSSLRSQIYKGWKKYVDEGGYLLGCPVRCTNFSSLS